MRMTMKEHMEMMDRINQGIKAETNKSRTIKIKGGKKCLTNTMK